MSVTLDVPLPAPSMPWRGELCGMQWLLERRADGVRCVASDGRVRFEGLLGLPEQGCRLRLEIAPPQHPIELILDTEVVLAPGGAVRGWCPLPLDHRLVALVPKPGGAPLTLVHVEDRALRTGWREGEGYHHPQHAELFSAPRAQEGGKLWVRAFFRNRGSEVARPQRCRLVLADHRPRLLRGLPIGPRFTWSFGRGGGVRVHPLPGRPSADSAKILQPNFRRLGETAS